MKIIDSSCWIEYLSGSELSAAFKGEVVKTGDIIMPTVIHYEVFKKLLSSVSEKNAIFAIAHLEESRIVDLTKEIALKAAKYSKIYSLPMADSIIYATGKAYNAEIYTMNKHFEKLPGVRYFEKNDD